MNDSDFGSENTPKRPSTTDQGTAAREGSAGREAEGARGATESPGELLRRGREAQDYTVADLCHQTKLPARSIEALEENRFDDLSQPVFAGGYYRQCAKVLEIDIDRMMAAYHAWGGQKTSAQAPAQVDSSASAAAAAVPASDRRSVPHDTGRPTSWRTFGLVAVTVVALVVIGVTLLGPTGDTPAADGDGNADIESDVSSTDTAGGTSASGSDPASASGNDTPRAATSLSGSAGGDASQGNAAAGSANGSTSTPASGSQQPTGGRNVNDTLGINDRLNQRRAAAGGSGQAEEQAEPQVAANLLRIEFTDRSWIEIRDSNGSRLLTGIYEEGDTQELEGETPYRVTLGFAPGVNMQIGGEPVDVDARSSSNMTARFNLDARDSE